MTAPFATLDVPDKRLIVPGVNDGSTRIVAHQPTSARSPCGGAIRVLATVLRRWSNLARRGIEKLRHLEAHLG